MRAGHRGNIENNWGKWKEPIGAASEPLTAAGNAKPRPTTNPGQPPPYETKKNTTEQPFKKPSLKTDSNPNVDTPNRNYQLEGLPGPFPKRGATIGFKKRRPGKPLSGATETKESKGWRCEVTSHRNARQTALSDGPRLPPFTYPQIGGSN